MRLTAATRAFFTGRDFLEVETPALQVSPGLEPHLMAFATELVAADQQSSQPLYLHTSPEFAMKKLLAAGLPRIFQLAHVFRNGERASTHSPEFTMLEWYRTGDYAGIVADTGATCCERWRRWPAGLRFPGAACPAISMPRRNDSPCRMPLPAMPMESICWRPSAIWRR